MLAHETKNIYYEIRAEKRDRTLKAQDKRYNSATVVARNDNNVLFSHG